MLFCVADMIYIKLPLNHCQHAVDIATPTGHKSKAKSIFTPPPISETRQERRAGFPPGVYHPTGQLNHLPQKPSRDTQLETSTRRVSQPLISNAAETATLPIEAHRQSSIRAGLCNALHSYSINTVNNNPIYDLHTPPLVLPLAAALPLNLTHNETQNAPGLCCHSQSARVPIQSMGGGCVTCPRHLGSHSTRQQQKGNS